MQSAVWASLFPKRLVNRTDTGLIQGKKERELGWRYQKECCMARLDRWLWRGRKTHKLYQSEIPNQPHERHDLFPTTILTKIFGRLQRRWRKYSARSLHNQRKRWKQQSDYFSSQLFLFIFHLKWLKHVLSGSLQWSSLFVASLDFNIWSKPFVL